MLKRSQVAKRLGVGIEAVRFYESKGLIDPPQRTESGYRLYGEKELARIRFVQHAKEVGFSLAEIKQLLELKADPGGKCGDVLNQAREKLDRIDERIQALERIRSSLTRFVQHCVAPDKPATECAFLELLGAETKRPSERASQGDGCGEMV